MKTRIQKWGNSLALRIPKSLAAESHLEQGMLVEVSLLDGKLLVTPLRPPAVTLEELLQGITPENLHHEVDTGPAVGYEAWQRPEEGTCQAVARWSGSACIPRRGMSRRAGGQR
jgi:antitoxin MazE